jgi:hypothetical protein
MCCNLQSSLFNNFSICGKLYTLYLTAERSAAGMKKWEVAMKRKFLGAIIIVFISLALIGCGNSHSSAPAPIIIKTQIFSDSAIDGDILVLFGSPISSGIIAEGMTPTKQSVVAGIDPTTGDESRAFLDFPLGGPNGVPLNAGINSATLDIFIDSVSPGAAIPIRIDLVSFPPPLIATDFDRNTLVPLASLTGTLITSADVNNPVSIDVTSLMVEAQNQALPNFQIRILEDFGPVTPGLIQIDDSTGANRANFAPLLTVEFF